MIGLGKYVCLSSFAAGAVIYHAFATREQFFPSMQYLTSSKLAIAVTGNLCFSLLLVSYRILTAIFLGTLREAEVERVNERISQAVMETCLAMTIFREEFNISFVAMFATLTFVKVFHWLIQDRVDYIETTPSVSLAKRIKILAFMGILLMVDALFLQYTISETIKRGPSVLLLFAFEYMIQASVIVSTAIKYAFIGIDSLMEGRWESKGVYVFYLELITDMLHLFVYFIFFIIVFSYYGLPLHLVRDLYWTFRNFRQRVADFLRYRRVTANMNERFPDASEEDLARCDGTCIICREDMANGGANKKLPCGHVFHMPCLRSWLERQQNCPTCRANVLQTPEQQRPREEPAAPPVPPAVAPDAAAAPADRPPQPEQAQHRQQPPAHEIPGAQQGDNTHPSQNTLRRRGGVTRHAERVTSPRLAPERGSAQRTIPQQQGQQQQNQRARNQQPYFHPLFGPQLWDGNEPVQAWGISMPMAMYPPPMHLPQQYAGQQAPIPPPNGDQQPLPAFGTFVSMPRMSVPLMPMMMPTPVAVPIPSPNSGVSFQQHQAAAAAAAAATAAVYGPWSGMMMMPPTMMAPTLVTSSSRAGGSYMGADSSIPNTAQQAAMATATATAAAAASAAAAAAMISSTAHTPSTAAQVLRSHIDYLQSQMRNLESSPEAATQPDDKGKAKVEHGCDTVHASQESEPSTSHSSNSSHELAESSLRASARVETDNTASGSGIQHIGTMPAGSEAENASSDKDSELEQIRKQRLQKLGQ